MNRVYRVIWSVAQGGWRVAAETCRSKGKAGKASIGALLTAGVMAAASPAAVAAEEGGQPVVAACTGIQLPASAVRDLLGNLTPVVGNVENTVENILGILTPVTSGLVGTGGLVGDLTGTVGGLLDALIPGLGKPVTGIGGDLGQSIDALLGQGIDLGLEGTLDDIANGKPLNLALLDSSGGKLGVLGIDDGNGACVSTSDGFSLTAEGPIAIGGNRISGLGEGGSDRYAKAYAAESIAFGNGAQTGEIERDANGNPVLDANGKVKVISGVGALALGSDTKALKDQSVAIGQAAVSSHDNSVALGAGSQTDRENSVSVGSQGSERQITHLAAGQVSADSHDAINGGQLHAVASNLGDSLGGNAEFTFNQDGSITFNGPSYNVAGNTYNTVGDAITQLDNNFQGVVQYKRNADGSVDTSSVELLGNSGTRISNVQAGVEDSDAVNVQQLKALAIDSITWDQDLNAYNASRSGTASKITNVARATLSADSSDVVVGSQLFETNQRVDNIDDRVTNIENNYTDLTELTGTFVAYDDASKSKVTLKGQDGTTLTNLKDGELSATSSDAVTGKQLFELQGNTLGFDQTLNAYSASRSDTVTRITNVARGELNATSSDVVVGSQLFETNQQVAENTTNIQNLDNRVTTIEGDITDIKGDITNIQGDVTNLDNRVTTIEGDIQNLADNAVTYDQGSNKGSVTLAGQDGTKLTNLKDAELSSTSTDAVTGKQLHQTNSRIDDLEDSVAGSGANLIKASDDVKANLPTVGTENAVAAGAAAEASGSHSAAFGNAAVASATSSTALGNGARATANNSVALGQGSVADRENSVSVGSAGNERQITNVAAGTLSTDAVNKGQLDALSSSMGLQVHSLRKKLREVERNANAGIAAAVAMEAAPYAPGKLTYAVGAGHHGSESAVGLTVRRTADNGRWSLSAGVAGSEAGATARLGFSGVID